MSNKKCLRNMLVCLGMAALLAAVGYPCGAQDSPEAALEKAVDEAIAKVKPALVRVEVVSTYYSQGRENKYESSGSGAIITKEGHVITNHHVAGQSARLACTLSTKEKIPAVLVGKDPLTDIAVIKLQPEEPREFPTATFGDSSKVSVGDHVLAMGSPMSLSQSVTLGIVSNAELVLPEWMSRWGGLLQDGEDVGALVRWIAHDAQIYGGNSGGPLVNLDGQIIGINEIKIGLGGAIPGNLARAVAEELIAHGEVTRAWLGITPQPRLKHASETRGVLVGSVLADSPAAKAGVKPGDLLVRVGETDIDVRFAEQLPSLNQLVADLPIGQKVSLTVLRGGEEKTLDVTPEKRQEILPDESEQKQWGLTVQDISLVMAKELKRKGAEGVYVTSVRPGGPAGEAKPRIEEGDILLRVNDTPIQNTADLHEFTAAFTKGKEEPSPAIVEFERKAEHYITVVEVGLRQIEDPGLEVKKAWLPVNTQVLTRDIAEQLGDTSLKGFRVTQVFKGSTAEKAGIKVGDYILEVDGEVMNASAPEDYDKLAEWIREYRVGDTAELTVLRGGERTTIPVELVRSPKLQREMKKYRDDNFEFTVRDITFFDKAREKWEEAKRGVLVQEVVSGGWADLGMLQEGDLLMKVDGGPVPDVETLEKKMRELENGKPEAVVFQVLRGIHTAFLEIEPKWEPTGEEANKKE